MNVIQYDVQETNGNIQDTMTHATGGPGAGISITTHEQCREVETNIQSGVIRPHMSISYQNFHFFGRGKNENSESNSNYPNPSDKTENIKQSSICTSTGDLDLHCKQEAHKIHEKSHKCLVLRRRVGNKRTQATQTENLNSPDKKDTSASTQRKNKGKKKQKNVQNDTTKKPSNNKRAKNKKQ